MPHRTLTLKQCRKQIEEDLGLESGALKPQKSTIEKVISAFVAESSANEEQQQEETSPPPSSPGDKKRKHSSSSKKEKKNKDDKKKKTKKSSRKEEPKPKPSSASRPRKHGKRVEKLKTICRSATITIPPTLYVKNKAESELEAALEALLDKHNLTISSGAAEIGKAKQRLQIQRDLDGIDSSNILEGGCRRRAAAAPVSYKSLMEASESEEEEEEEEGVVEEQGEEEDGKSEQQDGSEEERSEEEEEEDDVSEPSLSQEEKETGHNENSSGNGEVHKMDAEKSVVVPKVVAEAAPVARVGAVVDWSDDDA